MSGHTAGAPVGSSRITLGSRRTRRPVRRTWLFAAPVAGLGIAFIWGSAPLGAQVRPVVDQRAVGLIQVEMAGPRSYGTLALDSAVVEFRAVHIDAGSTLKDLLETEGLATGGDTYRLVYDANPWLKDPNAIPAGRDLLLPQVVDREGNQVRAPGNSLYLPFVDAQLKQETLEKASVVATRVQASRAIPEGVRERLLAALPTSYAEIAVASTTTLDILDMQLDFIAQLSDAPPGGSPGADAPAPSGPSPVEPPRPSRGRDVQEEIEGLAEDHEAIINCLRANLVCEVQVSVRTLAGLDVTHGLALFAAPLALVDYEPCRQMPRCFREFSTVSSPGWIELPVNTHWAIWASQSDAPVSDPKSIEPSITDWAFDLLVTGGASR